MRAENEGLAALTKMVHRVGGRRQGSGRRRLAVRGCKRGVGRVCRRLFWSVETYTLRHECIWWLTGVQSLIDLAGSEKATSDKERTREGKYINTR